MIRRHRFNHAAVTLTLLVLAGSLVTITVASRAVSTVPATSLLSDDFTHDTSLNTSLWQINGPVGSAIGPDDVGAGASQITLSPSFSLAGMKINQINTSYEAGTIQSVESFTPPFTVTAVVEGTISNGHTFGFAIATETADAGLLIYGNLNDTNCSHLGDCGDPTVCGTPANDAIPANQCYYGINAKVGQGAGNWTRTAKLDLTPTVNVFYTVQISVDSSGNAQYAVSQGGQVLGSSTSKVGTGPFYIVLEQAEGAPVEKPGQNVAYWESVVLTAGTTSISTTSTSTTTSSTSSGLSLFDWLIVVAVVALLLIIILLWYSRRRALIVEVQDSRTLSLILAATVLADGPEKLSGYTDKDGEITFKGPKKGDYSVTAVAPGHNPILPVKVKVEKETKILVKLDPTPLAAQGSAGAAPAEGPSPGAAAGTGEVSPPSAEAKPQTSSPQVQQPPIGAAQPVQQVGTPVVAQPRAATPSGEQRGEEELEGFGGGRIQEIIRTFRAKGAISPETAMTAEELGLSRLFVRIMKRRKGRTSVFMEINGKYYLNEKALQEK